MGNELNKVAKKAGSIAGMAGCTVLMDINRKGIPITIDAGGNHMLEMAGGLALEPEAVATAAMVMRETCLEGLDKSFLIHEGLHEEIARLHVEDDRYDIAGFVFF